MCSDCWLIFQKQKTKKLTPPLTRGRCSTGGLVHSSTNSESTINEELFCIACMDHQHVEGVWLVDWCTRRPTHRALKLRSCSGLHTWIVHAWEVFIWWIRALKTRSCSIFYPVFFGAKSNRIWGKYGGLFSTWWKRPFALSKMPSYILWQNALFQNALFSKGIFNKSILSRNIEGHFRKSKRAFQIFSLEMSSSTAWQNALIHNDLVKKGILDKSIL